MAVARLVVHQMVARHVTEATIPSPPPRQSVRTCFDTRPPRTCGAPAWKSTPPARGSPRRDDPTNVYAELDLQANAQMLTACASFAAGNAPTRGCALPVPGAVSSQPVGSVTSEARLWILDSPRHRYGILSISCCDVTPRHRPWSHPLLNDLQDLARVRRNPPIRDINRVIRIHNQRGRPGQIVHDPGA
jgi:hypothetical protein